MTKKAQKIILTDADGVLLNWEYAFTCWMEQQGYQEQPGANFQYDIAKRFNIESNNKGHKLVRQFNESAAIGFLPPLRDAQHYVKLLHEKYNIDFLAITSLSLDPYAKELRVRNLRKLFGTAFVDVVCLDTGADKDEVLTEYAALYPGATWIEDKPENAFAGYTVGLNTILVEHGHNMTDPLNAHYYVAKNWEDIAAKVTA